MSTLTTIQSGDNISTSRTDINNNFSALNTDKMETSVLDTDTTLAANSNSKVPTQAAVKAYVDAGGNVNASETTKGIVEEATDAEVTAGTATGGTGAKLFVTPAKLATRITALGVVTGIATGSTTKNTADASGTQTIAHGLGRIPLYISMKAALASAGIGVTGVSIGEWHTGGYYSNLSWYAAEGGSTSVTDTLLVSTSLILRLYDITNGPSPTSYQSGVISVDATNITITWTKTATPTGTYDIVWLAK